MNKLIFWQGVYDEWHKFIWCCNSVIACEVSADYHTMDSFLTKCKRRRERTCRNQVQGHHQINEVSGNRKIKTKINRAEFSHNKL